MVRKIAGRSRMRTRTARLSSLSLIGLLFLVALAPAVYAPPSHQWKVDITGFLDSHFTGTGNRKGTQITGTEVAVRVDSSDPFVTTHELYCLPGTYIDLSSDLDSADVEVSEDKHVFTVEFIQYLTGGPGTKTRKEGCWEYVRIRVYIDKLDAQDEEVFITHFGCKPSGGPPGDPIVCHHYEVYPTQESHESFTADVDITVTSVL